MKEVKYYYCPLCHFESEKNHKECPACSHPGTYTSKSSGEPGVNE